VNDPQGRRIVSCVRQG